MKKIAITILLALALSGCDKPKIDASNDESMKESIQKVRESLPEDKRSQFDDALMIVAFSQISMQDLIQGGISDNSSILEDKMKDSLAGKTGDEVITYADSVKKERAAKEKEQALQEIKELEEKQQISNKNLEQLKAFKVTRSRFYFEKQQYGRDQPVISLSVENGTTKSVSTAYFKGVIASPDREVPWFSDSFSYQISGGLEPGEKADWDLAPNKFSDWGTVDAPADAVFTVTVIQIDDAEGNSIFGDTSFNDKDASRLAELKAKYPEDTY
ncbi:DUF6694 family lipoprotein [Photorhabdus sp. P32]|uniref:DUF6694 family lipoprotein n=1 Tax=Photorhabdus sp. P32 TaxID=3117549 RepID=UPI00311B19A2